ncbi:MAG TPA: zinc-binding alcohol dehydrogenase family protein [Chthoniobacterales bacterium]|jgi:NADPH:quinone reductase-like Zn-dependent oxidoreductase|nr:zinc-binding alcohol dehydrogenase family protein [Chthoniobacterales bacterium]
MNAAVVEAFDRAPSYREFSEPVAGDGEVLVAVKAAGLHPIVKGLASGKHYGSTGELPFVPGVDGVGTFADGKRVYFGATRPPYGTFAERSVTRPGMCVPLPDRLEDATAAALANPGMSSRAALMRAGFVAGESVLILGATGSAGRLAVQIARRLDAKRIVGAGRNPKSLAELTALGADAVISLEQEHEALVDAFRQMIAEKIDIVLDYLWGQPAEMLMEAISHEGLNHTPSRIRYVQIGNSAGSTISLAAATLRSSALEMLGSGFGSASLEQILRAVGELFKEAAKKPFDNAVKMARLNEVEKLWNNHEEAVRLVFEP